MKTLIEDSTKESKFLWEDDVPVVVGEEKIQTPTFDISLANFQATLVENVTPPDDWVACKYLYDDGKWSLNPDWIDPATIVEEPISEPTPEAQPE